MENINAILAQCAGCSEKDISAEKSLVYDLMIDSVIYIELILEIEKVYGLVFPEDVLGEIETVGDLYTLINNQQS